MFRALILTLALSCLALPAVADSISSTSAGGPWASPATWLGGAVPDAFDDVTLTGPVTVSGQAACQTLTVEAAGQLAAAYQTPNSTLTVTDWVRNYGLIEDGSYNFRVLLGGDLSNWGIWSNEQITLTGNTDRDLHQASEAVCSADIVMADGASGDVNVSEPLTINANVDVRGGRLVLGPDSPFYLDEGYFAGDLLAGGNEMHFISWSYLQYCTLDDVVLVGEVEAGILVSFTTRVTVTGVLQNLSSTGGGGVTIMGDLINHGTIENNVYGFAVFLYGDLENNGIMTNSQIEFKGTQEHHLSMSPDAVLDSNVFLPEFQARTLIADTPVRFADGLGLGVGTLILQPGSSLGFTDWGGLGSGHIEANGNDIFVTGQGSIGHTNIDQGVFSGSVPLVGTTTCTGGLTVTGTLTSGQWDSAEVVVAGTLRNEGTIMDGANPVVITATGDVVNTGTWSNSRVTLAGDLDQQVAAGPGIGVSEFVLDSQLNAASYQWYKDGQPLDGETGHDLTLAGIWDADHGLYHCEGQGGVMSRDIVITKYAGLTDVPGALAGHLGQNVPNPFNPSTMFRFNLTRSEHARLTVYDLAGREVAVVVDGDLEAGSHQVEWRPKNLPSGVFFYRLETPTLDLRRKCTLLR